MSELSVRRDIELSSARYQKAAKAEKKAASRGAASTSAASSTSAAAKTALSENIRRLMAKLDQMTTGLSRTDRRLLQTGESSLTEVRDSLDKMSKLAEQAAGGGEEEMTALREGLEKLTTEVDRLLQSATYNGVKLFGTAGEEAYTELASDMMSLLRDLVDKAAAGEMPERAEMNTLMDGIRQLMDKMAGGATPEQALLELTSGGASSLLDLVEQLGGGQSELDLLDALFRSLDPAAADLGGKGMDALLGGLEGYDLDLLLGLAAARQSAGGAEQAVPTETQQFGPLQAEGQDLSGVSYDPSTGELNVSGDLDVTVGTAAESGGGAESAQAESTVLLTGSGTLTLKDASATALKIAVPEGKVSSEGTNELTELELRPGTSVELEGTGSLKIGVVKGDRSNTMKVSGGAVTVDEGKGDLSRLGDVVVEGGALLLVKPLVVHGEDGAVKKPLDLVMEKLIPGFKSVTSVQVDGQTAKMEQPMTHGEHPKVWLQQGLDSSHGYPIHTVVITGRDKSDEIRTRFAYLQWNEQTGRFEEVVRYPNPFTVTGGEQGTDWSYNEYTQTLRLLTDQVSAVSGGAGIDTEEIPFSGKLAIESNIGAVALTLDGVSCKAAEGRALDLGRENEVTLLLPSEIENVFESGPGFAGISVGDGTILTVDMPAVEEEENAEDAKEDVWEDPLVVRPTSKPQTEEDEEEEAPPPGLLTAVGGDGGAGIGRDSGGTWDRFAKIRIWNGSVTAVGGGPGAGIGAGKHSFMGDIEIRGGIVNAVGGRLGGAGIGGALGGPVGDIDILGGEISAEASYHAAAIGAGIEGECGEIRIGAGARIVKAKGGDEGADIGACIFGKSGPVTIEDGSDAKKAAAVQEAPEGISLHVGEETMTLPQLQLSARTLLLNSLNVVDWDNAWASKGVISAAMRRVERLREAYGDLHNLGDINGGGAPRTVEDAAALLGGAMGPIKDGEGHAAGQPGPEEVSKLLE